MLPTTVLPVIPTVLVGTVLVLSAIAFATVGRKDKSAKKRNELASVVPVVRSCAV